jgi:hypothetical protein
MHNPILGIEAGGQISYREQAVHKSIIKGNEHGEENRFWICFLIDLQGACLEVLKSV